MLSTRQSVILLPESTSNSNYKMTTFDPVASSSKQEIEYNPSELQIEIKHGTILPMHPILCSFEGRILLGSSYKNNIINIRSNPKVKKI